MSFGTLNGWTIFCSFLNSRKLKPPKTDAFIWKITYDEWARRILVYKKRAKIVRLDDLETEEEKERFESIVNKGNEEEGFTYHEEFTEFKRIEF